MSSCARPGVQIILGDLLDCPLFAPFSFLLKHAGLVPDESALRTSDLGSRVASSAWPRVAPVCVACPPFWRIHKIATSRLIRLLAMVQVALHVAVAFVVTSYPEEVQMRPHACDQIAGDPRSRFLMARRISGARLGARQGLVQARRRDYIAIDRHFELGLRRL